MFSENLARLQAERGITNYRLAKDIGVHQSTIKNWKTGTMPQPNHILLVADYFGVTKEDLLKKGGNGAHV